eukprot:3372362-Amphidinium_carterae.1
MAELSAGELLVCWLLLHALGVGTTAQQHHSNAMQHVDSSGIPSFEPRCFVCLVLYHPRAVGLRAYLGASRKEQTFWTFPKILRIWGG